MKKPEIRTASDQIVEDLIKSILRGELKLGQKLPPETELAEQYGVSRPTIRNALIDLEHQGILRSRQGCQGGWYITSQEINKIANYLGHHLVLSLNSQHITSAHLMEIRLMVEVKGSGLAAIRRTAEDIQAIAAAIPLDYQNMSDYEYHSQDIEFHRHVAAATKNPLLVMSSQAITMAQQLYAMTIPAPEKTRQELNQTLMNIYQAIVEQNAVNAEEAMKEHLTYYKKMSGQVYFKA